MIVERLVTGARDLGRQAVWRAADPFWAIEGKVESVVLRGRRAAAADAARGADAIAAPSGCPFHRMLGLGTVATRDASAAQQLLRHGPALDELQAGIVVRSDARDALAEVFAPLADDLHVELQRLAALPLDELPRAGGALHAGRYPDSGFRRWHEMRLHQVAGDRDLFRRIDHMVESVQHMPGAPHVRSHDLVAPIGDYGVAFSRALVEAGRVMDAAVLAMRPQLDDVAGKYAPLLDQWTFQKHPLGSFMEASGTYVGTAAVLGHRRVPGLDGMQLLNKIEASTLVQRAAARPVALAGPMFLQGFVPRVAVSLDEAGRLTTSHVYEQIIDATRQLRRSRLDGDDPTLTQMELRQLAKGCPILAARSVERADGSSSAKQSYITTLNRDFLALAKRFYERELDDAAARAATAGAPAAR